jgi:anaerobic sulfite reductase subunit B
MGAMPEVPEVPEVPESSAASRRSVMQPVPARVVARRRETADSVTLVLEPGEPIAAIGPGQFCMLWVPGVGEVAISISGRDHHEHSGALVHTIKRVGAVTTALCAAEVGDVIGVRGPFGRGWDLSVAQGDDLVLVAGGIGLAPVRSALLAALDRRADFGRVVLVVGARSPDDLVFADELHQWSQCDDLDVLVTVDRADSRWRGSVGVVTRLLDRLPVRPGHTSAIVCGPEVMMRFAARVLVERGVAPERVQVSLERNMRCGVGLCGHCQLGPLFLCRQGPVQPWPEAAQLLSVRAL